MTDQKPPNPSIGDATLRDLIATAAAVSLLRMEMPEHMRRGEPMRALTRGCYLLADAMLAERIKGDRA